MEFEHLTVTPYVNDKNRMAYSLRATGLKAAVRPAPAPGSVEGRGVTAARRVPALAVPVDARSAVTFLGYPNRSPLLAITTGRALLVTLTLPEQLEAGHVEFARQLACRAMAYAVEVERRYRGLAPLPAGEQVTA